MPEAAPERAGGGTPAAGSTARKALEEFYDRVAAANNTTELLAVRVAGNEAAAHFRVVSKAGDKTYTSTSIDTFAFNENGEIVAMRAYWGPGDFKDTGACT